LATPNKQQLYEKAKVLWIQDQYRNGSPELANINPEYSELLENGYLHTARSMLMSHNPHVVVIEKSKSEKQEKLTLDEHFLVDVEELLRTGCFISGGKGSTKTNLAKIFAEKLMKLGYVVKVFDISRAWLKSSIPFFVEIKNNYSLNFELYESLVFDLSQLVPKDIKHFISQVLAEEWLKQVNIPEDNRKCIVYIFEEVQILIPQGRLRSNEAQQILRLLTSGRNYDLSSIAITQRPALTDTSVFELCFQKYFARMNGENDLRKVASYIGFDRAKELENLRLGEFIYDKGSETKKISTIEFKPKTVPTKLNNISQSLPKQEITTTTRENDITLEGLAKLGMFLLWIVVVLVCLTQMRGF